MQSLQISPKDGAADEYIQEQESDLGTAKKAKVGQNKIQRNIRRNFDGEKE